MNYHSHNGKLYIVVHLPDPNPLCDCCAADFTDTESEEVRKAKHALCQSFSCYVNREVLVEDTPEGRVKAVAIRMGIADERETS